MAIWPRLIPACWQTRRVKCRQHPTPRRRHRRDPEFAPPLPEGFRDLRDYAGMGRLGKLSTRASSSGRLVRMSLRYARDTGHVHDAARAQNTDRRMGLMLVVKPLA